MKRFQLLFILVMATAGHAKEQKVAVIERDGRAYVSAKAVTTKAGIAIKSLPGSDQVVACAQDRCAPVKSVVRDQGDTLVEVSALSEALGATADFDSTRRNVAFHFRQQRAPAVEATARVGQIAPDFRLTKLDGSSVALSDYRGKRVLINSWASW